MEFKIKNKQIRRTIMDNTIIISFIFINIKKMIIYI